MYIKSGKYNKARIFLPEGQLDEATDGQIQSFLNNQAFCGMKYIGGNNDSTRINQQIKYS